MAYRLVSDPEVPSTTLAQWVVDRFDDEDEIADVAEFGPFRAFGVMKVTETEQKPLAVVIWSWYRKLRHGGDIRVTIYADSPEWCRKEIIRALFIYPFDFLGCSRITAVIKDGNERSMKLCKGLGFKKEGVLRRGYNGKSNCTVLGMLREECKWLNRGNAEDETSTSRVETTEWSKTTEAPTGRKRRRKGRAKRST